jgi:iron complex outermembrane receptor protein
MRLGELLVQEEQADRDLLSNPTLESASLEIATSTVESEQIRLQAPANLVEALEFATGMFVEERGRKEKQLVSFRGQIYPYPDYALNGVWQRSFYEVPSFLPAEAVERIEILRSGGAIMVGPNSGLVGAINIVPRRFDEQTTIFDVMYGSHNTFRESVVHGNRLERGYYTLGLSRYSTDGPEDENAAERFTTLFGTAGYDPADGVHLEITGFYLDGQRELRLIQDPGMTPFKTRYEQFDPYTSYGVIGRALFEHGDTASTEIDLGYARRVGDYERSDRKGFNAHELDWEYNAGILHAHNLSDNNTLRLGLQYNHWVAPDGKRFFVGNRMDVETYSAVLMDEHRFDRLTVDAGVRYTHTWYQDYTDTTFNITGAKLASHPIVGEWGDPAFVATLGAEYEVSEPVTLYAHAAAGTVDAPPGAVSMGSADLDREERLILDGGVRVEKADLGMLQVGGFAVFRDNAVVLSETKVTEDGDTFNVYTNSDVRQYGLEIEARSVKIRDMVSGYLTATVMTSERRASGGWSDYREIPNAVVTGGVYIEVGPIDVNIFGKYVSSYENLRFAQDGRYHDLGDYFDLNLTAGWSFGKDKATRIYCSFQNLLDDEYSTVVGYPDYGLQAFIGLQHRM